MQGVTNYIRQLFCPACGAKVVIRTDGKFPEVLVIPDHTPRPGANLCCGVALTVTIGFAKCSDCGQDMIKTRSGLCINCFGKRYHGRMASTADPVAIPGRTVATSQMSGAISLRYTPREARPIGPADTAGK